MPVAIAFAVVNSLLLLGMVRLTQRARRALPSDAQIPVHGGPGGWGNWWPTDDALFVWLFAGAVVWLVTVGDMIVVVADTAIRSKADAAVLPAVLALPMVILLVSEHYALKAARAASGGHPPA